jgi:hypothetical protein
MIGSLGFPIVACIFIAIFFSKTQDNYRADIKDMQAMHKQETDKMTEAINNNTRALERLIIKIGGDDNDE